MHELCSVTENNLRHPDDKFWTREYFSRGFPARSYFEITISDPPLKVIVNSTVASPTALMKISRMSNYIPLCCTWWQNLNSVFGSVGSLKLYLHVQEHKCFMPYWCHYVIEYGSQQVTSRRLFFHTFFYKTSKIDYCAYSSSAKHSHEIYQHHFFFVDTLSKYIYIIFFLTLFLYVLSTSEFIYVDIL
jgi:hypothetical protein